MQHFDSALGHNQGAERNEGKEHIHWLEERQKQDRINKTPPCTNVKSQICEHVHMYAHSHTSMHLRTNTDKERKTNYLSFFQFNLSGAYEIKLVTLPSLFDTHVHEGMETTTYTRRGVLQ